MGVARVIALKVCICQLHLSLFLFGGNNNPFHMALVVYSIEKCGKDGHPLQAYLIIQHEQ